MNWEEYVVQERDLQELMDYNQAISVSSVDRPLPNAGVSLYTMTGKRYNAIYDPTLGGFRKLNTSNPQFHTMGNRDLALYNDLLLNESVNTIIVDGIFGTGKTSTLCSHLVDGLVKELNGRDGGIPKAYISKPHIGVGEGYGYLPGDLHDKTSAEFKSFTQYFDRFGGAGLSDLLMMRDVEEKKKFIKEKTASLLQEPLLEILPFEYIRGLDIDRGWIVLDESQNTDVKEMATFISRPGDDAKTVVMGDSSVNQIDKRRNTPENNGLTFVKDVYIGKSYAGLVELKTVAHILRGQRAKDLYRALNKDAVN